MEEVAAVLAQLKVLVVVVDVIQLREAMAGRSSWPPVVAGHGTSRTSIGWVDYDFEEKQGVISASFPGTSEEESVEKYLAASVDHGSTCSRTELAC